MRTTSKTFLLSILGTMILSPSFVLAETGHNTLPTPSRTPEPSSSPVHTESTDSHNGGSAPSGSPRVEPAMICHQIGDVTGRIHTDTDSDFNTLNTNFQQRSAKVNETVADAEKKIGDSRNQMDSKRRANFADLEGKANTNEQKAAVTAFEAAINAAVAKRRAAVDAADATFKAGLLAIISTRQAQLKTAATTYKNAVAAAIAASKASCTAGTDPATVRATFIASLNAAKAALDAARKSVDSSTGLTTLKNARKAAIDKANADFKAAVQAALVDLKAAFPKPVVSPSPSPVATP